MMMHAPSTFAKTQRVAVAAVHINEFLILKCWCEDLGAVPVCVCVEFLCVGILIWFWCRAGVSVGKTWCCGQN